MKLLLLISLFTSPFNEKNNNSTSTTSKLESVTVFQSGAELNHTAKAKLSSGTQELIIDAISSYPDIQTIQIKCPENITILSTEFSNNFLGEEFESTSLKQLKDSLNVLLHESDKNNIFITTSVELLDVLRINKDLKGTQTGLSVAELNKLMEYYKKQSIEVQTELLRLNDKKKVLNGKLEKIKRQITEEQKKNTKSGGRLTLQVSVTTSGNYQFDISYITQQAYWTPFYDVKCTSISKPLDITYRAKIYQTTGIDWNKVKLSLSTATPSQYGDAPVLKTWFLGYINPVRTINQHLQKSNTIPSVTQTLDGMVPGLQVVGGNPSGPSNITIRGYGSISAGSNPLYVINGIPVEVNEVSKLDESMIKEVTVLKDKEATAIYGSRATNGVILITLNSGLEDFISVSESTLDVVYEISIPYDVPTNGKAQIATLKNATLPANYKHYAVPKLSKDVYLLAEVTNWQSLNLMPGEANIIFEGTYVGKSFIDPNATSDTLNLTLGTDKRVNVKKELITDYNSVKFIGSNKSHTITYELIAKNNKNEPIQLILKEPYPISTNKEINVNLNESSNGSVNEEIGVITWIINLSPSTNEKRRIGFTVKYPKNKHINL